MERQRKQFMQRNGLVRSIQLDINYNLDRYIQHHRRRRNPNVCTSRRSSRRLYHQPIYKYYDHSHGRRYSDGMGGRISTHRFQYSDCQRANLYLARELDSFG
jgi:hypothetical protein